MNGIGPVADMDDGWPDEDEGCVCCGAPIEDDGYFCAECTSERCGCGSGICVNCCGCQEDWDDA